MNGSFLHARLNGRRLRALGLAAALLRGDTLLLAAQAAEGADPGPLLAQLAHTGTITGLIERNAP